MINNDEEFAKKIKMLADKSKFNDEDKKGFALFIAYACDTKENKKKIYEYLNKDGITFQSLIDYAIAISPSSQTEIVDDEE